MTARTRLLEGLAAGAAGNTALNAVTYLDMAARGRPSSSTPQESVERLADKSGVAIPGDEDTRGNRVNGLGPLLGLATGLAVGAVIGTVAGTRSNAGTWITALAAAAIATVAGNSPMALLGVSDPRSWSATDWAADLIPHLAYGATTAAVLHHVRHR